MTDIKASLIMTSVILLLVLPGCSALEKNLKPYQVQRNVEGNVFSSSFPRVQLAVKSDLSYLGSTRMDQDSAISSGSFSDGTFEAASYLFGQVDGNGRLSRGVLIRLIEARGNPNHPALVQFYRDILPQRLLESGNVKILEEEYRYSLSAGRSFFAGKEHDLLKGIEVSGCLLIKQLEKKEGFGNKAHALIYYFEDASASGGPAGSRCLDDGRPSAGQERLIRDFTERSYQAVRFMKMDSTVDATSRYGETGGEEQISGEWPQARENGKIASVEERLKSLKDLFEKDLISKEEYEKKKAEILEDL